MKKYKIILIIFVLATFSVGIWYFVDAKSMQEISFSEVEAGFEDVHEELSLEEDVDESLSPSLEEIVIPSSLTTRASRWAYFWKDFTTEEKEKYENFTRPPGPLHVGIQVGPWKNTEVCSELAGLKRNGSGAVGGGKTEVDTVLIIARKVEALLEARGVVVDLLPATVPSRYVADAFVSIHADGNSNSAVSGFKIASPQTDFSGKSSTLASELRDSYEEATKLDTDDNVTRRMSAYYAFNWRRYLHTVHPMTPAVIVETGFMTSPTDRAIIVSNPDKAAKGIADGIMNFLAKSVSQD